MADNQGEGEGEEPEEADKNWVSTRKPKTQFLPLTSLTCVCVYVCLRARVCLCLSANARYVCLHYIYETYSLCVCIHWSAYVSCMDHGEYIGVDIC